MTIERGLVCYIGRFGIHATIFRITEMIGCRRWANLGNAAFASAQAFTAELWPMYACTWIPGAEGSIGVHCGPHGRWPASRRCPRPCAPSANKELDGVGPRAWGPQWDSYERPPHPESSQAYLHCWAPLLICWKGLKRLEYHCFHFRASDLKFTFISLLRFRVSVVTFVLAAREPIESVDTKISAKFDDGFDVDGQLDSIARWLAASNPIPSSDVIISNRLNPNFHVTSAIQLF